MFDNLFFTFNVREHLYSKYVTDNYLMASLKMSILLVFCPSSQFVADNRLEICVNCDTAFGKSHNT